MIVHSYIQTPGGMGLGDFLRGSLACHQLCTSGRTPYVITFKDHPIGEFIIPRGSVPDVHINNLNNQCHRLTDLRNKLSEFRRQARVRHTNIGVHCNTFPSFPLNRQSKLFVSHSFTPNDKLQSMIDEVTPTEPYEVIHVRTGDKLAYSTTINFTVDVDRDSMMKYIIDKINEISLQTNNKLIIMCDSDAVKKELRHKLECEYFPLFLQSNLYKENFLARETEVLVQDKETRNLKNKLKHLKNHTK
jgi:5S rRNA maturation endonuclease (ribonuclease M5)